jgi:hypothetical protein
MAVAASILTAIYHMLKDGTMYQDLGRKHFDRRSNDQQKLAKEQKNPPLGADPPLVERALAERSGRGHSIRPSADSPADAPSYAQDDEMEIRC